MKVLLDENLPHDLRPLLAGHDVFTVAYMGWAGVGNGKLLALAAESGFEVLLTGDSGLVYEQNRDRLPLSVLVLRVRRTTIEALSPLVSRILAELAIISPKTVRVISES